MKILISPNAFKGSLTGLDAATAIHAGFQRVFPSATFVLLPVADGGDGTVDVLVNARHGYFVAVSDVWDPFGVRRTSRYALLDDGTAVVEMADASGLRLIRRDQLDPMRATSFGTGQLIAAAAKRAKRIIVGLGGSAVVDGGAGILQALGIRLLDSDGNDIPSGAAGVARLSKVDLEGLPPEVRQCEIVIACDVENPLIGESGAARVFGVQKGVSPDQFDWYDETLGRFADLLERATGKPILNQPRMGVAGGASMALYAGLNGKLESGGDLILDEIKLKEHLQTASLVITGEGRLDSQTVFGKAPFAVLKAATAAGVPCLLFGGSVTDDASVLYDHGASALIPIMSAPMSVDEAIREGGKLLTEAANRTARLLALDVR